FLLIAGVLLESSLPQYEQRPVARSAPLWTLAALAGSVGFLPKYQMPSYPPGARLAPISPFQLYEVPLIGPFLHPNPLPYDTYREYLLLHAVRLMAVIAVCLGMLLISAAWRTRQARYVMLVMVAGLLLSASELLVDGTSGMYALFPSASRLVPGLATAALPWVLSPFFIVVSLVPLVHCVSARVLLRGAAFIAVLLTFDAAAPLQKTPMLRGDAIAAVPAPNFAGAVHHSPSHYVLNLWGEWAADPQAATIRDFKHLHRLKRDVDYQAEVTANPNAEHAELALDGDSKTRWGTGRPQQPGDSFTLTFTEPKALLRLVLSVLGMATDYPRGLRVEATLATGERLVLYDFADWPGPLKWSPEGFPYLGPQGEVIVDFPREMNFKELRFVQTASSSTYDWSIAEVKLFALP
ncbi:MAG: hypothetical protein KDD69_17430, partial [Bdellovibrionales bacterium]|nr:hypothetical protein [Bdellovibrionales bacterium]